MNSREMPINDSDSDEDDEDIAVEDNQIEGTTEQNEQNENKNNKLVDEDYHSDDDSENDVDEYNLDEDYLFSSDQNEKDEIDNFKQVLERLGNENSIILNQLMGTVGIDGSNRLNNVFNRHNIWKEKSHILVQNVVNPIQQALGNVNQTNNGFVNQQNVL